MKFARSRLPHPDRFWEKVQIGRPDECWPWLAGQTRDGYGSYLLNRKGRTSVSVAYELAYGTIPAGHVPDHKCRNRLCCNPGHLEAVTNKVNTLRGDTIAARNAMKTHCPRNHEYTPENTVIYRGSRCCITCRKERDSRRALQRRSNEIAR